MKHWQDYDLPDNSLFPKEYTVLELLNEGTTSTVLLAFDEKADAKVIIKCFKHTAKGAYLREISATYDMKHPSLVRCLSTFHRTDGESCLVYEYLTGGSLADHLKTSAILGIEMVFRCLQDILKALIYLHAGNRIHCDIKPDNIFLRPLANGEFEYVLGDLGAACFLSEAQEGQHVTGTPAYIAPERIRNQFFFNSDLYSLGVVAFEICTGYRPFMGNVEEITQANLSQIPSLEVIKYQPLRDLIDHLLAKSPQKRIQTASLAFSYLNKLQKQVIDTRSNIKLTSKQSGSSQPVLLKEGGAKIQQLNLSLEANVVAINCFHVDGRVLVALCYIGFTDIIDLKFPKQVLKTLINIRSIQITGATSLVYATPTRIQQLDLNGMVTTTLLEQINGPKNFHFYNNKLVFTDDFNVSYYDLNKGADFSLHSLSYLFDPEISLFESGFFCMSEGMANDKLVKRDSEGVQVFTWDLGGPLLAMARIEDVVLCVILDVKDKNKYSICALHESKVAKIWVIPHKIKQISCIENAVYWLTESAELYCCGIDVKPKMIAQFTQTTTKFSVSFDGLCIVALDLAERNQANITIFNNGES
jgi:serine/threonine protein kinase